MLCAYPFSPMYIGLAEAFWPGRSHCIERDDITFYLDGAHTRKSIEVMCLSCSNNTQLPLCERTLK